MNTSRKTKHVAEGMALWAAAMDLPSNALTGSPELKAWRLWCDLHPELVDIAKKEQSDLFDRLL